MKNKPSYIINATAGVIIILLSTITPVKAETYIQGGSLPDTVWTSQGNPYYLGGNVTISDGDKLTIEKGVEIIATSTEEIPNIEIINAELEIKGSPSNRVKIRNIFSVIINNSKADIKYTDILNPYIGLNIEDSEANISSTTISKADTGIYIKESAVSIDGAFISDNNEGVYIAPSGRPVLAVSKQLSETGGMGNIFENFNHYTSILSIKNSAIFDNTRYSVYNMSTTSFDVSQNWWGSVSGPSSEGENKIRGLLTSSPWLEKVPIMDIEERVGCCSGVLFIPGLQATRLHNTTTILGKMTENTLWEPNRNGDVVKLKMNESGQSVLSNIYAGKPIDNAYGLFGIYGKFMNFLNDLKTDGTISEWKAFGYDWRESIPEVVEQIQSTDIGTTSLISLVKEMSDRSPTGKISIVAHSNGGLVTKYLFDHLNKIGLGDRIDKIISVAVPFLGTPKAISSLLHGEGQSIASGVFLKKSIARDMGRNMPSAYSLLPSQGFFEKIFYPTIAFASSTIPGLNEGQFPLTIDNIDMQDSFITDEPNSRTEPSLSDTTKPIEGNNFLLQGAKKLHDLIDGLKWPDKIKEWSIAGINVPTIKSLKYSNKNTCLKKIIGFECSDEIKHESIYSSRGDGTVIYDSAIDGSDNVVSIDLQKVSENEKSEFDHANILESSTTESVIRKILMQSAVYESLPGVTYGTVPIVSEDRYLVISTHSPVDLHVYDNEGNHTGKIPAITGMSSDFVFTENNIPGSVIEMIGDDDNPETYVYIPVEEQNDKYDIRVEGLDFGEFTVKAALVEDGNTVREVVFENLPASPFLVATSSFSSILTGSSTVAVDVEGDGRADYVALSGTTTNSKVHYESLKKIIKAMIGNNIKSKNIEKRIDKIMKAIEKGKVKQSSKKIKKLNNNIKHMRLRNLSATDKIEIIKRIEELLSQVE